MVLPASIWAMIPMLRVFWRGCRVAISVLGVSSVSVDVFGQVPGRDPRWFTVRRRSATATAGEYASGARPRPV
ncbi:MAG TPA: hypothetical protein DGK99_08135 [Acidimicrobiaceae bacterium]|nr:hypothetical protein [Acidimicrobiaceae bacterium]